MKNRDRYNLLVLKALRFFIENPYSEAYLREFARKIGINSNTAQRFLELFLKEGLIVEERKANLRYFKANTENIFFRHMKITYSIKEIVDSGLIEVLKDSTSVILFGSAARGEDSRESDIDIVCISARKADLEEVQKKLDRQLNVHFFSLAEWKKQAKINKAFYQDIISTGINLIGEKPLV